MGSHGFTLLEAVVTITILAVLASIAVPMVVAEADREARTKTRRELQALAAALEAYFADHGEFPRKLTEDDFLDVYLSAGVDQDAVRDQWGERRTYHYERDEHKLAVVVTSVGPNGRYDGGGEDDLVCRVSGVPVGNRRTRSKLDVIGAALARFIAAGGELKGEWKKHDREALGLGPEFERDGFGRAFRTEKDVISVRSAGADGKFDTKDDLTL